MFDSANVEIENPVRRGAKTLALSGSGFVSSVATSFSDGRSGYVLTESVMMNWTLDGVPRDDIGKPVCTEIEADVLRALILSLGYECSLARNGFLVNVPVIATARDYELIARQIAEKGATKQVVLHTIESLLTQVRNLTFEERCLRTLKNIYRDILETGKSALGGYFGIFPDAHGVLRPHFRNLPPSGEYKECGRTFATPEHQGHFIYEHLFDQGWVKVVKPEYLMELTAKGFAKVDEMERGKTAASRDVFVIQPYNEELNGFLEPIFQEVGRRLDLDVRPVWGEEHVDRIDERIFRRIKGCAAVVLVVAPDRFNVGLEAGYALALGKPIVAIRPEPKDDDEDWKKQMPFDIATLNCHTFPADRIEELKDKLEARLALAIPSRR